MTDHEYRRECDCGGVTSAAAKYCPWCGDPLAGVEAREKPLLTDAPDGVRNDVPPSAKLVWLHLRLHGPTTQQALAEETTLTRRTVRSAIGRLEAVDAISSRPRMDDARQDYYRAHKDDA